MARVVREKHERGCLGVGFLALFWLFNAYMLYAVVSGAANISQIEVNSDAARAGAAVGTTIGFGILLVIWALGAVILGLLSFFTRGPKVLIEENDAPRGTRNPKPRATPPQLVADKGWFIEVVGEANYQDALERAWRNSTHQHNDRPLVLVTLWPEASNPHDPNAVRVDHRHEPIGYLPRNSALAYRKALGSKPASCSGIIVGGGEDEEGVELMLGIYLNALWPPRFQAK
jgi:hypothetical protein